MKRQKCCVKLILSYSKHKERKEAEDMAFLNEIVRMLVKMAIVIVFAGAGVFTGKKLRDRKNSKGE